VGDQSKKPFARINNWKKVLPDYEIKEWNETNIDINKHELACLAYSMGKYSSPAIDLWRVDILYEYGGIWLDTDVVVHESFEPFLKYSFFIGYEEKNFLNLGVMGVEAHHPIMARTQQWFKDNSGDLIRYLKNLTEYDFVNIWLKYCGVPILGALKMLYGFEPDGKPFIASGICVESVSAFTIRNNNGKNYAEHLYDGSWRECLGIDWLARLKLTNNDS
jgi:hypothetical protein